MSWSRGKPKSVECRRCNAVGYLLWDKKPPNPKNHLVRPCEKCWGSGSNTISLAEVMGKVRK